MTVWLALAYNNGKLIDFVMLKDCGYRNIIRITCIQSQNWRHWRYSIQNPASTTFRLDDVIMY